MGRAKESGQAKREAVLRAITALRTGDDMPTQEQVAHKMGKSVRHVRTYWPKGASVSGLIDRGQVGREEDLEFSAGEAEKAGYGIDPIARILGVERTKVRRLLRRR